MNAEFELNDSPTQWQEDLRFLAKEMEARHKNLFHTVTRERFYEAVYQLEATIPKLSPVEIMIGLARMVAMVEDGHTRIAGLADKLNLTSHAYSLLLYEDTIGMFVRMAPAELTAVVGSRLTHIGSVPIADAYTAVRQLIPHDPGNEQLIRLFAPSFLVAARVLHGLGIVDDPHQAVFHFERDGHPLAVTLQAGEIPEAPYEIVGTKEGWVDAAHVAKRATPLWLRHPETPFWFENDPDSQILYVQLNQIAHSDTQTVTAFFEEVIESAVTTKPQKFILDLRLNGGGNNTLLKPMITRLLSCGQINAPDKFFTIIGRRTFSAAQNLVNALDRFSYTTFVGEPTAENVNFFGDPVLIELPQSGLQVCVSALWWQDMDPRDGRRWTAPDIAAELTLEAYRQNRDPALEAIIAYEPRPAIEARLLTTLRKSGLEAAVEQYRRFQADPANKYCPSPESFLNNHGYELLGLNQTDEAINVFLLNTALHPDSWNAHDSLGEAYEMAGQTAPAIQSYEKSLALNPQNTGARTALAQLREGNAI